MNGIDFQEEGTCPIFFRILNRTSPVSKFVSELIQCLVYSNLACLHFRMINSDKTRLIGYQRLGCNQTALTYETGCFEHPRFLSTSGSFPCGTAGHLSSKGNASSQNGIIYSNFTLKTARRGLLIGHQPLVASAVEIDEGFTTLRFASSRPMKLSAVEIWAAGSPSQMDKLMTQKAWELDQVSVLNNSDDDNPNASAIIMQCSVSCR